MVNIPENARVEVIIRETFLIFVKKFGEPEAEEDVDALLARNRRQSIGR